VCSTGPCHPVKNWIRGDGNGNDLKCSTVKKRARNSGCLRFQTVAWRYPKKREVVVAFHLSMFSGFGQGQRENGLTFFRNIPKLCTDPLHELALHLARMLEHSLTPSASYVDDLKISACTWCHVFLDTNIRISSRSLVTWQSRCPTKRLYQVASRNQTSWPCQELRSSVMSTSRGNLSY
jgi:hypothetical protein